jgi:hypothetical protein
MRSSSRSVLGFCCLLVALASAGCQGWRPPVSHDVAGLGDPNATYTAVLSTLQSQKYALIDQDPAARAVRVRSHVDEHEPSHLSVILLQVDGAAVHISASGYLVHPDGMIHHSLSSELALLQKHLEKALGTGPAPAAPPSAPSTAAMLPAPPPAPPGSLPASWSEPAYDPKVWGPGNFTCLPVKIAPDDQSQLTLKLSNGENADVSLSLAYAPALCRSPGECKLPGGCPALGIGDPDHVSRIAGRLSRHEVGPLATLILRGQPIATIDLSKHGSIAQAMTEPGH